MYVTSSTTEADILRRIAEIENELNSCRMDPEEREALYDALDYLNSFLPKENY